MIPIRITIPAWNPTPLNKLMQGHWRAYGMKKRDRRIIAEASIGLPKAKEKRRVTLIIGLAKGQRKCDPDAYWKTTLDALVNCEMLAGDSDNWVELNPVKYERGTFQTTIVLEVI